jgi:hypothetical protein
MVADSFGRGGVVTKICLVFHCWLRNYRGYFTAVF